MITGRVTPHYEAAISVVLRGPNRTVAHGPVRVEPIGRP